MAKKTIFIVIILIVCIVAIYIFGWPGIIATIGIILGAGPKLAKPPKDTTERVRDAIAKTDEDVGSMDSLVQAGGDLVEQSEKLIRESKESEQRHDTN